jgi:hypothetical protein
VKKVVGESAGEKGARGGSGRTPKYLAVRARRDTSRMPWKVLDHAWGRVASEGSGGAHGGRWCPRLVEGETHKESVLAHLPAKASSNGDFILLF